MNNTNFDLNLCKIENINDVLAIAQHFDMVLVYRKQDSFICASDLLRQLNIEKYDNKHINQFFNQKSIKMLQENTDAKFSVSKLYYKLSKTEVQTQGQYSGYYIHSDIYTLFVQWANPKLYFQYMRLFNFYLQHLTLNNDPDKLKIDNQLKLLQEQNLKQAIELNKQNNTIVSKAVIQAEFYIHLYKTKNPIKFEEDEAEDSQYFYVQCILMTNRHIKDEDEYELLQTWSYIPCAKNILHNLKGYFPNNRNDFLATREQITERLNTLINIYKK
ncbi:DNA-binding [Hexamita inflata]|uniref:DNA-binding n=1 Tax=Hexamita inflata TaxID=28002 RepID=A0AA86NF37_9EUKA|nr:DNA-binding [Hexamita inflata]